jgi:2-polyprenyl-3-methyl-5-hydroxy-6-metoxy-1,4-benzoquinol methylase
MKHICLHTIAYSQQTLDAVESGYLVLDNTKNIRPDWREYWPIRQFLLTQTLNDSTFYGFFSPRFSAKTSLSHAAVCDFVAAVPAEVDVVIFSPQPDIGAFFPNVFLGGEIADPGFLLTCQSLVDSVGLSLDLASLVLDSRNTVFSNFVVARPSYWREWLRICETAFDVAENGTNDDQFHKLLLTKTNYGEGIERKVFVIEGVASLILARRDPRTIAAYNPFNCAWSSQLGIYRDEAVICDALKVASRVNGFDNYRQVFDTIQKRVMREAFGPRNTPNRTSMKQTPAHDLYNDTILALMPPTLKRVLEVGCMRGSLCRVYRELNADCRWVGVDIDPDNIEVARSVCAETHCRDIETIGEDEYKQWSDVDAWIFGDTLEHLRDPWAVIAKVRKVLPANGMIIASIPNAQHWSFQARVNVGQFRYENDGLFDRTHLRFFTRTTIFEMFESAGYRIESAIARKIDSPRAAAYIPHIRAMSQASGHDPDVAEADAMAFQYVVRAVPL